MTSLQFRLTASLLGATICVGLAVTALVYWQALDDSKSDLDNQMLQIARFASAATPGASMLPEARSAVEADPDEQISVWAIDAQGRASFVSGTALRLPDTNWTGFKNLSMDGVGYRIYSTSSTQPKVVVAQPEAAQQDDAAEAAISAAAPVIILIPVLGLLIGWVVRRQLAPVRQLAIDVAARTALSLEPLPDYDVPIEIRPLTLEIDRLLSRQRVAMEREHRFIVDAAHAIRTPLAALQLQSDILDGSSDASERARRLAELKAGIRRTARLSNHLLALADNTEAGTPVQAVTRLDESITEVYRLYLPVAVDRRISLTLDACTSLPVAGTNRQHALIFGNLVDNALRYTEPGNSVGIVASVCEAGACVRIEDDGPGIPESERLKVMDRFYRLPGDDTEGSGLGLSVVRAMVGQLGGSFELSNRSGSGGLIAKVTLKLLA